MSVAPRDEPEHSVLALIDAFHDAFAQRDLKAAMDLWSDDPDACILGSGPGESFVGPARIRACFEAIFGRPTIHGWHWKERRVSIVGPVAWMVADADWLTRNLDASEASRPYRVTGIFKRQAGKWRWVHYHGSEPLGVAG